MADFPALPLFTDAYLGDTMHLGLEEHGAYLKLLMVAWRSPDCALPDDDQRLANMLGVPLKRWCDVLRPVIAPFWSIEGGRWRQKKLSAVRAKVAAVSEKRRAAAKASHEAKSLINGQAGPANAPPLQPTLQGLTKTKTKTKEETLPAAAESRDPRAGAHEAPPAADGFADLVDALHERVAPAGVTRRGVQRVVDGWVGQIGEARTRTAVAEALVQATGNPLRYAAAIVDRRSHALDIGKHAAALPLPEEPDVFLDVMLRPSAQPARAARSLAHDD